MKYLQNELKSGLGTNTRVSECKFCLLVLKAGLKWAQFSNSCATRGKSF
jgi:hypothetical protein